MRKNKIKNTKVTSQTSKRTFPLLLLVFIFFVVFLVICRVAFAPYVVGNITLKPYMGETKVDGYPNYSQKLIKEEKFYLKNFSSKREALIDCFNKMNEYIDKKYNIYIPSDFSDENRIFANSYSNLTQDKKKYVSKNKLYPPIDLRCKYSSSILHPSFGNVIK